jgi:hypothetical protein
VLPVGDLIVVILDVLAMAFVADATDYLPIVCARSDLYLISIIEHLGQEELKRPQDLADAYMQVLRARHMRSRPYRRRAIDLF